MSLGTPWILGPRATQGHGEWLSARFCRGELPDTLGYAAVRNLQYSVGYFVEQ